MTISNETVFLFEGIFYRRLEGENNGYEVIPSPVSPLPLPPPPPPMPPMPVFEPPDMVTIRVHGAGSATSQVVLKRSGHRWIGPGGEEYDRLPTEQQLSPAL